MINPEILREYDIRGIYEKSLTLNDVTKIALSITKILINNKSPNIIIGHDGRTSSLKIKNTLKLEIDKRYLTVYKNKAKREAKSRNKKL